MDKAQIIEQLANEKTVEKIISNCGISGPNGKDLAQDVYVSLLLKPEELIEEIYDRGEIVFYISRMVTNNINSKTSPFYNTYRKSLEHYGTIEDLEDD